MDLKHLLNQTTIGKSQEPEPEPESYNDNRSGF